MDTKEKLIADRVSILMWQCLFAILFIVALFFMGKEWRTNAEKKALAGWQHPKVEKIKLDNAAELLFDPGPMPEAPSLSPDGKQMVYMTKQSESELFDYEIDSVQYAVKNSTGQWEKRIVGEAKQPGFGESITYFNPTFDANASHIISGVGQFWNVASLPFLPSVKTGLASVSTSRSFSENTLHYDIKPEKIGLPGEVLQHPKVSPNGEWLTFYTRKKKESRGIYLWNLKTKKLFRISGLDDKHPTWTPDGRYILFHHQEGGDALDKPKAHEPEQAYLGYFELTFTNDNNATWKRILLDQPQSHYRYFKHPAQVAQTPLLFFHGKLTPDGKHSLLVRRLAVGSPIYQLDLSVNGKPLKEIKHPANAVVNQTLVFLAKSGKEKTYKFYQLKPAAVQTLLKDVK